MQAYLDWLLWWRPRKAPGTRLRPEAVPDE
jgi:hypothetical protein